ncbi:MAG: NADH-quinone oxidoreductase subunit N [Verrucomicrobia bacterium]|nr:NADH-quinone oxidoreductase subunit N [Verrucomicrobiota bacterium]
MKNLSYIELLLNLLPQVALVVTAFAALAVDFVVLRRSDPATRFRVLGWLTALGLVAAGVMLFVQFGQVQAHGTYVGPLRTLVLDPLTVFFQIVIVVVTIITVFISMAYPFTTHVSEYYAVLLFGALGMNFLVASEELIAIFVSLELLSVCLYILTAFHKGMLRSAEGGLKYFLFGAVSSAFMMFGLAWTYGLTGDTTLAGIGKAATELAMTGLHGNGAMLGVALLFTLVGFGFKIAVAPFHQWAPDAYEGSPTPATAFIATGSKIASFFILVKALFIGFDGAQGSASWGAFNSGWIAVAATLAAVTLVVGNTAAIVQRNVKRLLAYSAIAHAGYILTGLVAANALGAASVFFYIIVYAFTNLGAFGIVAALSARVGGDDFKDFAGIYKRAPRLTFLMLLFVLSLAGIPPLGGFFGKFYLFTAALSADPKNLGLLWLVTLGIAMSAVSLYYYLILLKTMYVTEPAELAANPAADRIVAPWFLNFALLVSLAVVLWTGLAPQQLLGWIELFLKSLPS